MPTTPAKARFAPTADTPLVDPGAVPVPAGMECVYPDDWENGNPPYRFVWGECREVPGTRYTMGVQVSVAQFSTGALDTEGIIELPLVHLTSNETECGELTAGEARQFARALIAACDEIDRIQAGGGVK